tara:strand:- start:1060 stop:2322 length:1263 start_codon:yes stop_codon:yes gene_type:complete
MIVIKDGKNFAKIYASTAFDKWGVPTNEDIRIVEKWNDIDIPKDAKKIDADQNIDINFNDYYNMIENTLWIFNNEKLKIKEDVYMTGGGVNWMFQKGKVNVYDISKVQVKFIKSLLADWDGKNYGEKVYNFIKDNNIIHFHVNLNEKVDPNKKLFEDKQNFINAISENFEMLKGKYAPDWEWKPKDIFVFNDSLINVLPNIYLGKINLSNIFDFKYYFAKLYTDDVYKLLAPSTKAFIQKHTAEYTNKSNPACIKVETNVPSKDVYNEIQNIKKYLVNHRSDSGIGWRSFCIHGQKYSRTKEDSYYKDFLGHKWTPEAIEHMPLTIKWLKSLGYKNFQRVRVMCLDPKSFINLHRDQTQSKLGPVNVAINNPKDCKFYLQNHGVLEFDPGTAYQLDLVNYHTVVNNSNVPRYHIIIHGDK